MRGVVSVGPTSSGKSGLSLELAERYHAHGRKLTMVDRSDVRDATLERIVAYTRRQRSWFTKIDHVRLPRGTDAAQWIVGQG